MKRLALLLALLYRHLALGWLLSKAAVLLVNAVTFPRLRPAPRPTVLGQRVSGGAGGSAPRVSILIPARDEAHNLPQTLPGVLAQGADEVLVLDDGSTDGTGQVAQSLLTQSLRTQSPLSQSPLSQSLAGLTGAAGGTRVVAGQPLPAGWYGKPWACQQLLQAAVGDILVFTDADVTWHPGALCAVLAELNRTGADLLSVQPRQANQTWGERLLTPLVDSAVLSYFPYPLMALPQPAASLANGQVMVFRRPALERVGGYALVRQEVLEDTQFARRLKARGGRLAVALGHDLISVRMYRSYPQSVAGFAKNILPLHGHLRPLLLLSAAAHLLVYTLPWLVRLPGGRALRLASLVERPLVNLLAGRRTPSDLAEGLLGPITPLLAAPVYWRALRRHVTWKGRRYQQE